MRRKGIAIGIGLAVVALASAAMAQNTFTGAGNNRTDNDANWASPWQDWDDAVFADWTTVRASATAGANRNYETVLFNAAINEVGGDRFIWNTLANVTNFVRTSITVHEDVEQTVRLGGPLVGDGDTLTISHQGSGKLEAYQAMRQDSLDLTYLGNDNTIEFGGGAVNNSYTGTTVLDNLTANVIVNGAAGSGAFGHGNGTVELSGGTVLNLGANQIFNAITGATGSETRVRAGGATRSNDLTAEGDLVFEHDNSNTAAMLLTGDMHIDADGSLAIVHTAGRVTQLRGALTGSGDLKTADTGTTLFWSTVDASGFTGDVYANGVTQYRLSDAFGSGTVYLNEGVNFRGFSEAGGADDHSFGNEIVVHGDARMATTGNAKESAYTMTIDGGITFAETAELTLEAGGHSTDPDAANVLLLNGVIADGAGVGSLRINNAWGGTSFMNAATVLTAENTYSGSTTIQTGTLKLTETGSIANSSQITISADGVLDVSEKTGGMLVGADVILGGSGTVMGDIVMEDGAKLVFSADMLDTTAYALSFTDTLSFAAGSDFWVTDLVYADGSAIDWDEIADGVYTLVTGTVDFDNVNTAHYTDGFSDGRYAYFDEGSLNLVVIPEPATMGMMLAALAGVLGCRRLFC